MQRESLKWNWTYIAAGKSRALSRVPAELAYIHVDITNNTDALTVYNGVDSNADVVTMHGTKSAQEHEDKPPHPYYLSKGLYIDVPSGSNGATVQWREYTEPDEPIVAVVG